MKKYFWCFLILFSFSSLSQTIREVQVDIKTGEGNKKAAIRQAINQISRELVENFLGKEKYRKNRKKVKKTIMGNQNRYVLSSKSSNPVLQEDGKFLTVVTLGVSENNLEKLLLEHNLFYKSHGSLCVLPVISFVTDLEKKKSYLWWSDEKRDSLPGQLAEHFYNSLSLQIVKSGFYGVDPIFSRFYENLPSAVLKRKEKIKNLDSLTDFLQCHIVISGKVFLKKSKKPGFVKAHFTFKTFNIQTNQVLFQMRKQILFPYKKKKSPYTGLKKTFIEISKKLLTSMAWQLSDYREKGTLDLSRLFLGIQGPLLYFEREALEAALVHHIHSIKSLKKTYMSASKTVYEMKSSKSTKELVDIVKKTVIPDYQLKVIAYNKRQVEIYVKKSASLKKKF